MKEFYELKPKNIYGLTKKFNEEMAEIYSKVIPQLVYSKANQYFISVYVSILFGKRK
jgi:nucleoside-diphosphate-sugar epimerase